MTSWRSLLLVYPKLDVVLNGRRYAHELTSREIEDAVLSFKCFPSLVEELTDRRATVPYEIVLGERPMTSLTAWGDGYWWPTPDDVREELVRHSVGERFDSVFILWPQNDFPRGVGIDSGGWGLGMGASPDSEGATYAVVGNAVSGVWDIPTKGEVWLHEWLHGACSFFRERGFEMPDGDADGGDRHGYKRSPETGWMEFYRDLTTGMVVEEGVPKGIPPEAWRIPPRSDGQVDH